jgi:hypothetical protein
MAAWTKFNSFTEALAEGTHNLGSHTLRIALSNSAPSAGNTVLTDITQIAASGGYTPAAVTVSSSSQTGGTYSLVVAATTFTAAGADFAPFRYAVLYNDTAASDPLIAYYDYGTSYTLPDGQPFTFNAGTVLTLA